MMTQEEQQATSLAATVQALSIVHDVASEGKFDAERAAPVLQALVNYNPDHVLSAYGGNVIALQHGVSELKKLFGETLNRDVSQYLLAVIGIELKLVRNKQMRQLLQTDLQRLGHQIKNQHIENVVVDSDNDSEGLVDNYIEAKSTDILINDELISEFANLYKQTASQTEPRIMVKGNHSFLQQDKTANQIRALLLAALRGAAFFRHCGGKRFDLMMKRSQYLEILDAL